ncbi:MAG: alpha/beta hydrolase [Myxococcota bacterium]
MPTFTRGGVSLVYEEHGAGKPLLMFAPGGMRSRIAAWQRVQPNLIDALSKTYRVIVMDQRNAGASWAPIHATDGWSTYTNDHLALLDHLGIGRFHALGVCIGGSFIAGLALAAPDRLIAGAMLQPIGLDNNRDAFLELFDGWASEIKAKHPETAEEAWASFRANLYEGDKVLFNASEEELTSIQTPLLVLMGNDLYHPSSASRTIAARAPNATLVEQWKEPEFHGATLERIAAFLAAHP